jgi:hypothetical protein
LLPFLLWLDISTMGMSATKEIPAADDIPGWLWTSDHSSRVVGAEEGAVTLTLPEGASSGVTVLPALAREPLLLPDLLDFPLFFEPSAWLSEVGSVWLTDAAEKGTATLMMEDEAEVDPDWTGSTFLTASTVCPVSCCLSADVCSSLVFSFLVLSLFSFFTELDPLSFFSASNARRSSSFLGLDPMRILLLANVPHAELPGSTEPPLTFRIWWPWGKGWSDLPRETLASLSVMVSVGPLTAGRRGAVGKVGDVDEVGKATADGEEWGSSLDKTSQAEEASDWDILSIDRLRW